MKNYVYQNNLITKKQLKQLLAWSFSKYDSMQACSLADDLKYLGFKYATQAGISISIEDLKVPSIKNQMLKKAYQDVINAEKIYLKGKITDVERFQKIIDTWSVTSESLKNEVVSYFKNYDPLNSVYIMAFSGARGNLSQVRQLVGMRGLMSDPNGEILKLPIKKNFREGLTITDYLMSGYGARKGIVDTALKTANSGYLTRRLIDVSQDIIIREKDCKTYYSCLVFNTKIQNQILGRLLSKPIFDNNSNKLLATTNTLITPNLISIFKQKNIKKFYIRSPLTCTLYRSICQKCYGWDLANENLVDIGESIGIIAGQSIGEPGTQLTMRTFHTGGIFTSETRQQIISPINGIIKFSKILKTIILRTNRGEDVLLTKNSGSLIIIPENKFNDLITIELVRNTILFNKNRQYIKKDTILGELTNITKQIRTEIKSILSPISGEIFIPKFKNKLNFNNTNKFLWILFGRVYQAPLNSFLNFYTDYKINKNNYIFRTKLINYYSGLIKTKNNKTNLFQRILQILSYRYNLYNSYFQKLNESSILVFYILNYKNLKYKINLKEQNSEILINVNHNKYFGSLLINSFKTKIGGILYYDKRIKTHLIYNNNLIFYLKPEFNLYKFEINKNKIGLIQFFKIRKNKFFSRSIVWLEEETYKLNCDKSLSLVEQGNFISKTFEIIPGVFSKTSGIVGILKHGNMINEILIKCGLVYQGEYFKNFSNKVYYPGEIIFNQLKINQPSLCQLSSEKSINKLLIRPLKFYEISLVRTLDFILEKNHELKNIFKLTNKIQYLYKSNQKIKSATNINLVSYTLQTNLKDLINKKIKIEFISCLKLKIIKILIIKNIWFSNYIPAYLKYTNIQSCLLVEKNQYIESYTVLGYLEKITPYSLEIVKFKSKFKISKQILLISNEDCVVINKSKILNKPLNDLINSKTNFNQIGKIIIDNETFLTIQKGQPYFFPNCKTNTVSKSTDLSYKILNLNYLPFSSNLLINRNIFLNYYDVTKRILNQKLINNNLKYHYVGSKLQFSKMFIKKNGKLYSSAIPIFFKSFILLTDFQTNNNLLNLPSIKSIPVAKKNILTFMKNSNLINNKVKKFLNPDFVRLKFFEYPFKKSITIHSITEDFFEQEINSLFCKNGEFIQENQPIGLLNFEKEITGDIVQGLPRIEELLEARKTKKVGKNIAINRKKSLLIQKTSLDSNFEFRKFGTTIKENEKINPHNLVKVYFNYYGLFKQFFSDQNNLLYAYKLTNSYEASYKTFKKVQSLILNSVQSVYNSQGVTISDKHLEVIIKQMTTKVLITHEGNTPLLPREVIDLYHIRYINLITTNHNKTPSFYVPLLLGITKAALNNPSFISAASFQETTRVLTKAAIEGKVDWLRGLKENIIIGHLIPAGTGSQNYKNCFQIKKINQVNILSKNFNKKL